LLIGILACLGCEAHIETDGCDPLPKLLDEGNVLSATKLLQKLLADNPRYPRAAYYRAMVYETSGQFDLALAGYTNAIQLDKEIKAAASTGRNPGALQGILRAADLIDAHCRRGKLLNQTDKADDAVVDFSEALDIERNCAAAYCGRGIAYLAKGQLDLAFSDLTEALWLKPEYAEALHQRVIVSLKKGNVGRAVEDCQSLIHVNPQQANAYYLLGSAYVASSPPEYDQAVASFREAMRLEPQTADKFKAEAAGLWYDRAISLYGSGKKEEATRAAAKATALDPSYGPAFIAYIDSLKATHAKDAFNLPLPDAKALELGKEGSDALKRWQFDAAIKAFTAAVKIDPKYAEGYYGRGCAFLEKGFPNTAIKDFSEAMDLDKFHINALVQRARAYIMAGVAYLAVDDATQAIRRNPGLAEAYLYRGKAYLQDGQFDLGIADLDEAVLLNPSLQEATCQDRADAYRARGLKDLKTNRPEKAVADFKEAIAWDRESTEQIRPHLTEALRARARKCAACDETRAAFADLEEALRLDFMDAQSYKERGLLHFQMKDWPRAIEDLETAIDIDSRLDGVLRWPLGEAKRQQKMVDDRAPRSRGITEPVMLKTKR
jgi:tetratricopeptide (TPR) repeat protein